MCCYLNVQFQDQSVNCTNTAIRLTLWELSFYARATKSGFLAAVFRGSSISPV